MISRTCNAIQFRPRLCLKATREARPGLNLRLSTQRRSAMGSARKRACVLRFVREARVLIGIQG